jgi:hypothetical protein
MARLIAMVLPAIAQKANAACDPKVRPLAMAQPRIAAKDADMNGLRVRPPSMGRGANVDPTPTARRRIRPAKMLPDHLALIAKNVVLKQTLLFETLLLAPGERVSGPSQHAPWVAL